VRVPHRAGPDAAAPGEERFLGIFDLRGFTASNADIRFVGFLVSVHVYSTVL